MAENKTLEHLPEVRAAVAALSPEDRELLMAVQASPDSTGAVQGVCGQHRLFRI